jgi:hypothetical protein
VEGCKERPRIGKPDQRTQDLHH